MVIYMEVKSIDLWFDHKSSQSLDPFIFDEKTQSFDFDKVILCPNLVGHCKIVNPRANGLEHNSSICPDFNGGIIFLKNGVPIRLYLCQNNQIVEDFYGHKFGVDDILNAIHSNETIGTTGKTMLQLLEEQNVTVVVDKPERPVPLKQLGSGSNWVGVHLIAYFALHKFFINAKRPVPRFLFLDQPSQVYFPSELDEKQIDWNEVYKMYKFIIDRTNELNGKLQVIIVDHADLKEKSFRQFICENWWQLDNNLVPNDWYEV